MYAPNRKLLSDMDKTQLIKMRSEGMTNQEIADAVGCSKMTIYRILGPMSAEEKAQRQRAGGRRSAESKWSKTSEGGYTVERKMKSFMHAPEVLEQPEQEQAAAILAVKRAPIMLTGSFMDYVVSADSKMIDVEKEGRTLIQIPTDSLSTFINELATISRNIKEQKPMQFWG